MPREFAAVGGHYDQWVESDGSPMGLWEPRVITKTVKTGEAIFYVWLRIASAAFPFAKYELGISENSDGSVNVDGGMNVLTQLSQSIIRNEIPFSDDRTGCITGDCVNITDHDDIAADDVSSVSKLLAMYTNGYPIINTKSASDNSFSHIDSDMRHIINEATSSFKITRKEQLNALACLYQFTPKCYRIRRYCNKGDSSTKTYQVCMENITCNYTKPCVLDVKMGTTYDTPYLTFEKQQEWQRRAENCTTSTLGVRITGLRGYHYSSDEVVQIDREVGKVMKCQNQFQSVVEQYIRLIHPQRRREVCQGFIYKMKGLRRLFRHQTCFILRQSSLLFVFDSNVDIQGEDNCNTTPASCNTADTIEDTTGDSTDTTGNNTGYTTDTTGNTTHSYYDLRLIDFAHSMSQAKVAASKDQGFLIGLSSLIEAFGKVLINIDND